MKVQLVSGDTVVSEAPVAIALHDQTQLVVGVVSENPAKLVGELKLLPSQSGAAPTIATLTPADLPERIQAWAALDRLVWQDVDASALTPGAARGATDLDRRWRAPRHRGWHRRRGQPHRLPGRPAPLPAQRHPRHRPGGPAAHPRRGTGGCRHADRVCGRGRCRAGPGDLRWPRDRRGPQDRQRVRDAAGLRPTTSWLAAGKTWTRRCGGASCRLDRPAA